MIPRVYITSISKSGEEVKEGVSKRKVNIHFIYIKLTGEHGFRCALTSGFLMRDLLNIFK